MKRRTVLSATLATGALAACGTGGSEAGTTPNPSTSGAPGSSAAASPTPSATSAAPVAVALSTAHGLDAMLPTDSLQVTVSHGTLTGVSVADAKGRPVKGTLTGTTWKSERNLLPQTAYVATITATDAQGATSTTTKKFSTLTTNVAGFDILYDGFELGVGMPATIQFVSDVETAAMRAEVEKHVKVTVTPPQEGSWGWLDERQLMWRPKEFFKPGTTVKVEANLAGIQTGPKKWIGHDATGSFTIGDARILYTEIDKYRMRVTKNGKTVRTIPVTNGKPGFTTRSGTKVIIERDEKVQMNSETVDIPAGSPNAYNLLVHWAMRLTWTGEFIHAAPWSVRSQGEENVSHGCTGISDENARWLFDFCRAGDVDIVTGTSRIMQPTEGIGVWQVSWPQWKQRSALA